MPDEMSKVFSFDTGIEQVLWGGDPVSAKLPEQTAAILPSEDHPSIHLNKLFEGPSLDSHILASLKPDIQDKNILIPARYHALLAEVHEEIKQAAQNRGNQEGGGALEDAAALLEEVKAVMGLLETYRNILHQA